MKFFDKSRAFLALAIASFAFLVGCEPSQNQGAGTTAKADEITILAGSELKDIMPAVQSFAQQQNKSLKVVYSGSLDAVDTLSATHNFDMVWLSHAKYLQLVPAVKAQIAASEKTMYSQVVLGVKQEKVNSLGWGSKPVSWKDILQEVKKGNLTLAMTNPSGSNTGFVTLVGVAASLSGKADALNVEDIPQKALKDLFSGVVLTSGSSGDLANKFVANATADAMINYESVIKSSSTKLVAVKPSDGVVTADYPLMLLKASKQKAFYDALVAYLRSDTVQKGIVTSTGRMPLVGAMDADVVNELPFPGSLTVVDAILAGYMNEYSKPSSSYFVLDTSGSMRGERIDALKQSVIGLATNDGSVGGRFSTFRQREIVRLARFTDEVFPVQEYALTEDKDKNLQVLAQIRQTISGYVADGGTGIYSAIANIYPQAQQELRKGGRRVTIVLMTDGKNENGMTFAQFQEFVQKQGTPRVPIFGIVYGEANAKDMDTLVNLTEGAIFDATKTPLQKVFKQIRAYQ